MVWQKHAGHVPEWLNIRMVGLRESLEHIGFLAACGLSAGVLYGSALGWTNYEEFNGRQIAAEKWARGVARSNDLWVQICEDNPKHPQCGDNLKRLCKAQPDAAACGDYRSCLGNQNQPKCVRFKDW